ncbi:type VI secretion system contractile sheath small subunit [Holophaga foetida]|uniref:type VI secretion system contractile sheath small subunit n=1 Tax=Holophaga foetida TaxID=35839 RepID=UPI00024725E7|nr:type VI secretion system contractile sheath small subunit [Holophaga foetida]
MSRESTQKRIARDRAPRVQINYDVEVGGAIETKELPFVLGVMGDYSGHSKEPLPKLKDRKFVQIDGERFDDVMKGIAPRLVLRVDNKLKNDDSQVGVELNFNKMEDFEPLQVVQQVDPLRQLLEARTRLSDLRGKLAGNDKLEELLEQIVHDTEKLQSISRPQPETEG